VVVGSVVMRERERERERTTIIMGHEFGEDKVG